MGLLQPRVKTHRGLMVKPKVIFRLFPGDFIYRHHVQPLPYSTKIH